MTEAGTMSAESASTQSSALPRWRLITSRVLVVLASLLALLAVVAGYVRYQALDTPTVENTAGQLIADPQIRTQVAALLVDQLYSNVDVAAVLRQRLPPQQQGLAGPIAGALRELTDRASVRLLARPRIQALWVQAVAQAHSELVRLLNDRGDALKTSNGNVVLNLRPLVIQLGNQVAIVGKLADRLPPGGASIKIMSSDQLRTAQRGTHLLDVLGQFLAFIALGVAALAVWLARGRRRTTLRSLAIGIIIAGIAVLFIRRIAGSYVVDGLVPTGTTRSAVGDSWDILTSLLADGGRTLAGLGVVTLVGTWLAGPTRAAQSSRRTIAPLVARPGIVYGAAVAFLLLLVWWGPTAQLRRPLFVLTFGVLLVVGVWVLRRLILAEHPNAGDERAGAPFARAWASLRGGRAPQAE